MNKLKKISKRLRDWPNHLHTVLWADRVTTLRSSARVPFDLVFSCQYILPVDVSVKL